MASVTWRENPAPVRKFVAQYRAMDDAAAPNDDPAAQRRAGKPAETRFYAAFGGMRAAQGARWCCDWPAALCRCAVLEKCHICRAWTSSARARVILAISWSPRAVSTIAEDAFYLTAEELGLDLPSDMKTLVAQRRTLRDEYLER